MKYYHFIIYGIIFLLTIAYVPLDVEAGQNVVLFDEGHGQRFLAEKSGALDLSGLALLVHKEGLQVKTNKGLITKKLLVEVDALIISGAFAPITQPEIEAIIDFVKRGGKLSIMLHIGFPFSGLLRDLGISVSNGVVHEQENIIQQHDTDYYVTASKKHELTDGIKGFKVFGGWALFSDNKNAEIIAQTSTSAWVDLNGNKQRDANEVQQSLYLAIAGKLGEGSFVVFGDDAIFQNRFLSGENMVLGQNLARWFKGSKKITTTKKAFL